MADGTAPFGLRQRWPFKDDEDSRFHALDRALHRIGPFGGGFIVVSAWIAILFWKGDTLDFFVLWHPLAIAWVVLLLLWSIWVILSLVLAVGVHMLAEWGMRQTEGRLVSRDVEPELAAPPPAPGRGRRR